jgi:hypothetical protein
VDPAGIIHRWMNGSSANNFRVGDGQWFYANPNTAKVSRVRSVTGGPIWQFDRCREQLRLRAENQFPAAHAVIGESEKMKSILKDLRLTAKRPPMFGRSQRIAPSTSSVVGRGVLTAPLRAGAMSRWLQATRGAVGTPRPTRRLACTLLSLCLGAATSLALGTNQLGSQHQMKLFTQRGYLPGIPVLVRVELHNAAGRERDLWDANATLSADQAGVGLSTNRVLLRNGMGSALVTVSGGADFTLTARVGALQASRQLVSMTNSPVVSIGGTLSGSNVVWSGIIRVTNDVIVTTGTSLTILSNTLVLIDGAASGTNGNDLVINGKIESLGTEDRPVTITCGNRTVRFAGDRFVTTPALPSLYRLHRRSRAPGAALAKGTPALLR